MTISYHPSVEDDLLQATTYYDDKSAGLGDEYLQEVEAALERLKVHPKSGAPTQRGIRSKIIRRFPYSLLYTVEGELLTLVAVAHHRRDPTFWHERL